MFNSKKGDVSIQKIEGFSSLLDRIELFVLREDDIHPTVSGNKFRKLKYNVQQVQHKNKKGILSFGGAYSNHIAALAAAGRETGINTVGIIRGEELKSKVKENPTLHYAQQCGMELHFVTREAYRDRTESYFLENISIEFKDYYIVPEGGTNEFAVKGCEEILSDQTLNFDYICTPVGTGGTIAGIIKASQPHQSILGFSALKGTFQKDEIRKYTSKTNYELLDEYCFGGYGKIDANLVRFINDFKFKTEIQLDPVYTGKMMFGIFDLIKQKKLKKNSRILAVHTGGLQGIAGMNQKLKKKKLPQIEL
ncbi:pyridoxal-phosphate dependent enzyme [Aureisphaera sp. CAU 1614]|uniref:Pyridoxal-phosphate dependent enzyme n=1 Tax=Halomarinibacterium sedimenti TaxID=2857106 RepID=A0A9X1FQK3_9FLAO|nr:pyridoxal-phosphate dependent enzyme [Halomarinibacterium sedimenti]MBW2938826.1 pyridoxal-phosphate dependent enzyme [Halomarinibacterium sedimenti]